MSHKLTQILKQNTINTYRKYGNERSIVYGGGSYSGEEIAQEIENESEIGILCINNLLQLAIDLVKRDKIHLTSI